jgi:signal transduction histidine kinase/ligand-binding sensor domain-containing protein
LLRLDVNGVVTRHTMEDGLPSNDVRAVLEDQEGSIWAGTTAGLVRLHFDESGGDDVEARRFLEKAPARARFVEALFESSDGTLWAGTSAGLCEIRPGEQERPVRWYTAVNGLKQNSISSFAGDRRGDLWIGTQAGGVMRLTRNGFLSYTEAEGLPDARITSIFETRAGELCATATGGEIYALRDGRFNVIRPNVEVDYFGWGWNQWTLQDREGDWWIPTGEGLFRFHGIRRVEDLGRAAPVARYTMGNGLSSDGIFRLYEDSRGDVWIGTISGEVRHQLTRWDRRSGAFERYGTEDGIPIHAPTAFRDDGRGNVWIGFYAEGLARYRDGAFERFTEEDGCPAGFIRAIHLDGMGRLWIASERGGVARVDDPGAARPVFVAHTVEQGLASNLVASIVEDLEGRIYLGTDRGIDRLDPESGEVRHYGAAHGLPNEFVNTAHRDREGRLWFGTLSGIARLEPGEGLPRGLPPARIRGVRIAGTPLPLSELGEIEIPAMRLAHSRNRVFVEFGSIATGSGPEPLYQHLLDGADPEWSAPAAERTIDYANLAPGSYRFLVRSVAADGRSASAPAGFSFTVVPPLWRRGWVLTLGMVLLAAATFALHRLRVARAVELERVRTRIATDLHDDIGSSLSRIAILTELLQRKVDPAAKPLTGTLGRIAGLSRELVDSMSDIVWAINPKRDRLSDVVFRMRRFAADAFTGSDIEFSFRAPSVEEDPRVGPDLRRELYLVFKESVNNAVRHSGCSSAAVELSLDRRDLTLTVRDDGRGFDPEGDFEGHGLASMRRRAAEVGGTLEVASAPGNGTTVTFRVPLGRAGRAVSYMNRWGRERR